MVRWQVGLALHAAVLGLGSVWAGRASAQEEPAVPTQARPQQVPRPPLFEFGLPRSDGRAPFALLLHAGDYSGFGAGVAVGTEDVGVRASVGWSPAFFFGLERDDDFHFYSGLQVSPDVYVRLFHPRSTTDIGFQGGYRYSTLFGHGGAAGAYMQFAVGRSLDVLITGGVLFYPDGEDHLRTGQNLPGSTTFPALGPDVNVGLSVGLALFP